MWKTIAIILLRLSIKAYPMLAEWLEKVLSGPPPKSMDPELHNAVMEMLPQKSASAEAERKLSESEKVELELIRQASELNGSAPGTESGEPH